MKTFNFTNNDQMPVLGLGTWKSDSQEVYEAIIEAVTIGYRHIDCSPVYSNEKEIGHALKYLFDSGTVKWEELWITSKLWCNSHEQNDVIPALKNTLSDLKLDYLDLFLIHWPIAIKHNILFPEKSDDFICLENLPIHDTWTEMEHSLELGLTRHIGVSNFSLAKLRLMVSNENIKPEVNQIELHPLLQQNEMLGYCHSHDIILTAYSPLGSKDRNPDFKAENEPSLLEHPEIVEIAQQNHCTTAQVLIKWAIHRGTSVIPKSTNPKRLKQNFEAVKVQLSDRDMDKISTLDRNFRYINGSFWAMEGSSYTLTNIWDE